jgi:hypothetical protein
MVTFLTKLVCQRRIQFYIYFFIVLAQSFKLMLTKILGGNWEANSIPLIHSAGIRPATSLDVGAL